MMASIPALLIEFTVQTVFLLAALWIMIKLQKLDSHFLGLVGAAALASAIALVPLPFHLADIISCSVLLLCIAKVTGADCVDVKFTVFVGYALMFGMNLFLLGAMLGDLRPSARAAETERMTEAMRRQESAREPLQSPAQPAPAESAPAPAAPVVQTKPVKSPEKPVPPLSVKALTRNGAQSSVTLQSGQRSCTLFLGDSGLLETASGEMPVHFDELTAQWILLTVEGQHVKLAAP